ncbi:valine--tRNA ligase [Nanoarchaeota archaeon]
MSEDQQTTDLPKKYDPQEEEPKLAQFWQDNDINEFDPDNTDKPIFSIDTPPPTVSGKMHIGHSFSYSHFDFIARYKRMKGFNVLMPIGTDDNGLPTQTLIQKKKKVRASDMSRNEFVKLCLETLENELRPEYLADFKRLGMSYNWKVNYSTIDPHCRKISQKSFIDLYKAGRQYRTEAPAMHCPKCATAIAQVECEDKEIDSTFNDIIFKVDSEDLIIATTRPELLPACVGVFFHPDDERYQHLDGKKAKVPLFDIEVPIMPDKRAEPDKGTGIVMCCTFGDVNDTEWQKAHKLPIKKAIDKHGRMTDLAGKYKGLKIEEARKQIIDDMKEANLLTNQKPIRHAVNVHERCGTPIEFVHSKQWFVKYLDKKPDMLHWGTELDWKPKHYINRYENWVQGLAWDWCISRQIFFGIPFPVWYCKDCDEIILADESQLPIDPLVDKPPVDKCPKCGKTEFIPEKDIINTWATSSLTPTIAKELFKDKPVYEHLKNNPMDLRPQAHDIISFWLFNTVVKSQLHYDMKPWNHCMISGWMLDPKGKKMSKSKGNVIEPMKMIEKYSADALRYLAGGSKLGDDLSFQEKELVTGKKTITKIWNATKFAIMQLEGYNPETKLEDVKLRPFDQWCLSKLQSLVKEATENFNNFQYSKVTSATEIYFWQVLCDNYLEICKDRLYNPDKRGEDAKLAAQYTLYHSFKSVIKLFAPIMPYITEKVYQLYFAEKESQKSIHNSSWPEFNNALHNEQAEIQGDMLVELISAVRKFKSEKQVSLKKPINLTIECDDEHKTLVNNLMPDLKAVTNAQEVKFDKAEIQAGEKFKISVELLEEEKKE